MNFNLAVYKKNRTKILENEKNTGKVKEICEADNVGTVVFLSNCSRVCETVPFEIDSFTVSLA